MYSFAQRADTYVFDEPFYAVYLKKSGADHPGKEEVMKSLPQREEDVRVMINNAKKPVVFVKNMAHHMEVLDNPLVDGAVNVFLIRDPRQIIASYSKVIKKPVMRDIGIEYQFSLFNDRRKSGKEPVVVDSAFILQDPREVLQQLCAKCGINFEENMLQWKAGPKPYDGVWAPYWYDNVHRSTGFQKSATSTNELPDDTKELYERAKVHYEKLLPFSLKAW
jgi:hypothetical protein